MIKSTKFARKAFYVDAVQVTAQNMEEVAAWCQGDVQTTVKPEGAVEEKYIKVRVHRPLTERQTKAFIGDWVLYAGTGFKVYTPRAFEKSFEKVVTLSKAQADEAGIHPPIENKKPSPKLLARGRLHSVSLDVEQNPGGGKIESARTLSDEQAEYAAEQERKELAQAAEAERLLKELQS